MPLFLDFWAWYDYAKYIISLGVCRVSVGLMCRLKACFQWSRIDEFCVQAKEGRGIEPFFPNGNREADTSRLPKGGTAWPIPTYFQRNQPNTSLYKLRRLIVVRADRKDSAGIQSGRQKKNSGLLLFSWSMNIIIHCNIIIDLAGLFLIPPSHQ
jgi:hypothetical protein